MITHEQDGLKLSTITHEQIIEILRLNARGLTTQDQAANQILALIRKDQNELIDRTDKALREDHARLMFVLG